MSKRDYYEVLGVANDADEATLKSAFRKRAGEFHPDRHPDLEEGPRKQMEEKFKEVAEAYQVLSDGEKRARYDRFGHAGTQGGGAPQGGQGFGGLEDVFGDLFEGFFGGNESRGGSDLRLDVQLDLEEALRGKSITVDVPALRTCVTCVGSGAKQGTRAESCKQCGGRGRVRVNQGFFSVATACPVCRGAGQIIKDPCQTCRGEGRTRQSRKVKVDLPAGIEDQMQVRLRGEGESGPRGAGDGDLYVMVRVRSHALFSREGADLVCELPVSFPQAALGVDVELETILDGPQTIKVPAGTQYGRVISLKGKGAPRLQGRGRGDLLVSVVVETPSKLSDDQKRLLEEFSALSGEKVKARKRSMVDRAKRIFE